MFCEDGIAFAPDGLRAQRLYARVVERLADSVEEIIRGCSALANIEEGTAKVPERIRASSRIAPEAYCIYFDLLQAVDRDDLGASLGLLSDMRLHIDAPQSSLYRRWGALPPSTANRYFAYVNVDPTTRVIFKALDSSEFDAVRRCADDAFTMFERAAPEIAAEIRSLVTEIIFVSGEPDEPLQFDGATSFFCWGALFLNADHHRDVVAMIEGLAHESAHAYLFALSLGDSFVNNPDEELRHSPLRVDLRPLDGIFHATYVSARMHYAHSHVLESHMLSESEEAGAKKALAASRSAFWDGFKTLEDHASLTPLGRQVIDGAHSYMIGQADVALDS